MTTKLLRRASAGATAAVLALIAAPAAQATTPLAASATDCETQTLEQPFWPWLDPASYVLAPDGTFEAGAAGWSLSDGADVVAGNEPYHVHGPDEHASLALGPRSSATSGWMCVGIEHPTLRFVARNTGGALGALGVDVVYRDGFGVERALTIGRVVGHTRWAPTVVMPVVVNLFPLLPGSRTMVAFRFTPEGAASSWQIDDVYVDPYRKG